MERKVQAAGETSRKQCMLPGHVPGQVDSACSKVQRRAGAHQWAEEWQVHHLRRPQENLSHQRYCGMNMELSKWSFFSLPEGIEQCLWRVGTLYCSTAILWNSTKSDELKTWIHLCWFLGVSEYSWKYFPEFQSPLVFWKLSNRDLNTRWNYEGDFPVLSPQSEWQGREVLNL